ncbi:MAG: peptidoglycan bridge formation glycyltransferase FemA/FemB family protein, partial [Elusimicrobiota bacterium]|jgi:lipid II:glycine glycyltransferase (peptidoglycan interpeptide bridge formation enzyme)
LQALKREYADKRGLFVRVRCFDPSAYPQDTPVHAAFIAAGFQAQDKPYYMTILMDISPSLETLRKNLLPRWRRNLVKAEKNNLTVRWGMGSEHYGVFRALSDQMFDRKHPEKWFDPDFEKYWAIQDRLPEDLKMAVVICESEGEPVAANVLCAMGNTGMYLFGATGEKGVRDNLYAAYLLQWACIQWLKDKGYARYDLRGYHPERFPGVSQFKSGMGGDIVDYAEFRVCSNRLVGPLIVWAEWAALRLRWLKSFLKKQLDRQTGASQAAS